MPPTKVDVETYDTTEEIEVHRTPALTARDRCDGSAAEQARVRLKRGEQELLLCAHHYRDAEWPLVEQGWTVVADDRWALGGCYADEEVDA